MDVQITLTPIADITPKPVKEAKPESEAETDDIDNEPVCPVNPVDDMEGWKAWHIENETSVGRDLIGEDS